MSITASSIKYRNKRLVPNDMMDIPLRGNDLPVGVVAIRCRAFNPTSFKSETSIHYLEYYDSASKRIAFRSAKLIGATAAILREHDNSISNINQVAIVDLIKAYAELFDMPLSSLGDYQKIKGLIVDKLLNDIIKLQSTYSASVVEVLDIRPGKKFSTVRIFTVESHYRR